MHKISFPLYCIECVIQRSTHELNNSVNCNGPIFQILYNITVHSFPKVSSSTVHLQLHGPRARGPGSLPQNSRKISAGRDTGLKVIDRKVVTSLGWSCYRITRHIIAVVVAKLQQGPGTRPCLLLSCEFYT